MRNSILTHKIGDVWVKWVSKICQEVVSYFLNHFSEPLVDRPQLDVASFSLLIVEDNVTLYTPFTIIEIDKEVS